MRWDHVGIKSRDTGKSLHFYCDLLGLKRKEVIEIMGKTLVFVGNDTTLLEIEPCAPSDRQADPRSQTGLYHLAFEVRDLDGLLARLTSEGVPVVLPPFRTRPDRRVAFVEDPDGVFVQLIEMTSGSS